MSNKEQEVKLQFLEEAQEYLNNIESGLLGLAANGRIETSRFDAILRAAHSIKGGAAMMGYHVLSQLAHRLEDFFKVIKAGKTVTLDEQLESLLLSSLDGLRNCIRVYRQGTETIEEIWLETSVNPIFNQLHELLGDPTPEDEANLLSEEAGEDIRVLLFESEVEGCLQRLESVLSSPEQPCLREEFLITTQELGGLGEMLEIAAFTNLCESIHQHLEAIEEKEVPAIAQLALQEWRRSQALVLIGQIESLPIELNLSNFTDQQSEFDEQLLSLDRIDGLLELDNLRSEAFSWLSSLETSETTENDLPVEVEPPVIKELINQSSPESKPQNSESIRVPVRQLEQLGDLFGELIIERNGLNLQLKTMRNLMSLLSQRVKTLEKSNLSLRNAYDANGELQNPPISHTSHTSHTSDTLLLPSALSIPSFDLLEMDRYSDLHLLFQEMMETIVQIKEVTSDLETNLDNTQKTARDLTQTSQLMQNQITQVRMSPLSDLVGRFPRALRDMALQYGKQVELKITGGSTLIDRTILDVLSDPLLHLLRNAFDHGIEDPAIRNGKGKSPQGLIEISATYRGNQTIIKMRDDGSGIDLEKIRARALNMGFDEPLLAQASQNDLLNLIFEPGFSTAEQVTDLSGRGVGMDIVRTKLQQIRGQIQVETKPDMGTTFTITVPFTLSVIRVLLVESAGMLLAFPTSVVDEMLLPSPDMIMTAVGQEFLNWEEYMVPLIRLHQWLHFSRPHPKANTDAIPTINQPTVLMISQGSDLVGLQVERYWGEQEVTIRNIEGTLNLPPGLTGCTILGDGRVVPLVDAPALLEWIGSRETVGTQDLHSRDVVVGTQNLHPESKEVEKTSKKNWVMVVDDSINVRRFVALTLEKAGYRVQEAKDGQEALEKLQNGLPIQAVICDVEMPRMDGFGFLAQVKSNSQYNSIPILMLTSRSGDKHRQIAMNLGATAYFTKPFQERELLQTLKSLIISQ